MKIFFIMLMLGNLIYAKTYIVDCSKSKCVGDNISNLFPVDGRQKCKKPANIGFSKVEYTWNSDEEKCYAKRVYTKKEKEKIRKKEELKKKKALLQQKKIKASEKRKKDRELELKNFDVYAGVKMYSYIKENKTLSHSGSFKLFGLNGKVKTNNQGEIIGIELDGKVSNDKAEKIKKSLLKKYTKLSEKKYTKFQSYNTLNDRAYKLYQLGIITGKFYKMFADGLTDKSSKIEEIILKNNTTQIVFKKIIVDFRHKIETFVDIGYLSKKLLNLKNKKKRIKEKQQEKISTEINDL